jgi:hypothetical protein
MKIQIPGATGTVSGSKYLLLRWCCLLPDYLESAALP